MMWPNKNTKKPRTILLVYLFTTIFVAQSVYAEPLTSTYTIPAESWFFISEEGFQPSSTLTFEWESTNTIEGINVDNSSYESLQELPLLDRFSLFVSLNPTEGKGDFGTLTADENGRIYFVFLNAGAQSSQLDLAVDYLETSFPTWIIGLLAAAGTIVIIVVTVVIAGRIRRKMIEEEEKKKALEAPPEQKYLQY